MDGPGPRRPSCGQVSLLVGDLPRTGGFLWEPGDNPCVAAPALTWGNGWSSPIHSPYHHCFVCQHNTTVESESQREVPM